MDANAWSTSAYLKTLAPELLCDESYNGHNWTEEQQRWLALLAPENRKYWAYGFGIAGMASLEALWAGVQNAPLPEWCPVASMAGFCLQIRKSESAKADIPMLLVSGFRDGAIATNDAANNPQEPVTIRLDRIPTQPHLRGTRVKSSEAIKMPWTGPLFVRVNGSWLELRTYVPSRTGKFGPWFEGTNDQPLKVTIFRANVADVKRSHVLFRLGNALRDALNDPQVLHEIDLPLHDEVAEGANLVEVRFPDKAAAYVATNQYLVHGDQGTLKTGLKNRPYTDAVTAAAYQLLSQFLSEARNYEAAVTGSSEPPALMSADTGPRLRVPGVIVGAKGKLEIVEPAATAEHHAVVYSTEVEKNLYAVLEKGFVWEPQAERVMPALVEDIAPGTAWYVKNIEPCNPDNKHPDRVGLKVTFSVQPDTGEQSAVCDDAEVIPDPLFGESESEYSQLGNLDLWSSVPGLEDDEPDDQDIVVYYPPFSTGLVGRPNADGTWDTLGRVNDALAPELLEALSRRSDLAANPHFVGRAGSFIASRFQREGLPERPRLPKDEQLMLRRFLAMWSAIPPWVSKATFNGKPVWLYDSGIIRIQGAPEAVVHTASLNEVAEECELGFQLFLSPLFESTTASNPQVYWGSLRLELPRDCTATPPANAFRPKRLARR